MPLLRKNIVYKFGVREGLDYTQSQSCLGIWIAKQRTFLPILLTM